MHVKAFVPPVVALASTTFVKALEQAPCSAFTYRLASISLQDALQVTSREIGLIEIIFLRPLADQLTCDIRKEQ